LVQSLDHPKGLYGCTSVIYISWDSQHWYNAVFIGEERDVPIWAVSLFALIGCVDPVTSYNGLDYKSPLSRMIFQLCLYCGYVLLMSVSNISGVVGNLAIGVLSALTFIKGFHRSLELVLPGRMRDKLGELSFYGFQEPSALAGAAGGSILRVNLPLPADGLTRVGLLLEILDDGGTTSIADIYRSCSYMELGLLVTASDMANIEDVCLGYSLSHVLRCHFLGLVDDYAAEMGQKRYDLGVQQADRLIDFKRVLKAIVVELAFLYEVFFKSNEFLHYYEAKTSAFWAFASFTGICFVGIATAIPGTMTIRHRIVTSATGHAGVAGTVIVVDTTTTDLIITLVILVSLALLQLVQLIQFWASNWATLRQSPLPASTPETGRSRNGSLQEMGRVHIAASKSGPILKSGKSAGG
jgi:hypothetical protein